MPGTTRAEIRTLKIGRYVAIEEDAYKILSMSKSKPGKHGSAKARIELEDIFTGQKKSHVGTVTDTINIPLIEKDLPLSPTFRATRSMQWTTRPTRRLSYQSRKG